MEPNQHKKVEQVAQKGLQGLTLLGVGYLVYRSLHECDATCSKCGMTDNENYLTVLAGAYGAYIVLKIIKHTRPKAIKFVKELSVLIYVFVLLPHVIRIVMEPSVINVRETLFAMATIIGVELLIEVYLWLYNWFNKKPPRNGQKPNSNPAPRTA